MSAVVAIPPVYTDDRACLDDAARVGLIGKGVKGPPTCP